MTGRQRLNVDPLPALLAWHDTTLAYWVQRDLLDHAVEPVQTLWETQAATRLTQAQQPAGSWRYRNRSCDPETGTNYDLLETYRQLREDNSISSAAY